MSRSSRCLRLGESFISSHLSFGFFTDKFNHTRHMVPYDQPEASLDLFTRWILDIPLSLNVTKEVEAAVGGPWA